MGKQLKALSLRTWSQATPDWLEYWFLLREPQEGLLKGQREHDLVEFLRDGPRPVPEILKHLGVLHVAQAGAGELMRQEVIGRAGLTSTDLMHIEGRYDVWDVEASTHAWQVFCQYQFRDPDELRRQVWTQMSERIDHAVLTFLSERPLELADRAAISGWRRSGCRPLVLLQQPLPGPSPPGNQDPTTSAAHRHRRASGHLFARRSRGASHRADPARAPPGSKRRGCHRRQCHGPRGATDLPQVVQGRAGGLWLLRPGPRRAPRVRRAGHGAWLTPAS